MTQRGRSLLLGLVVGLVAGWLLANSDSAKDYAVRLQNRDVVPALPAKLESASFGSATYAGRLEDPELTEVSGLTASGREPDLLWALNDSSNEPSLYALKKDGGRRGRLRVRDTQNFDWEALARFEKDGAPYLLIGDIGDNGSTRDHISFYAVKEPLLGPEGLAANASVPVAFTIDARYEDGPRDAEAMAVDPRSQQILILSKRTVPPVLYSLPLEATEPSQVAMAKRVGIVDRLPAPTEQDLEEGGFLGRYYSQPTALRLADDGRSAVVLTYKDAYEFPRNPNESWAEALAQRPRRIPLPPLEQAEAAALDPRDGSLWVTSEKRPAPLFHVPKHR